jgi:hypothetical protein
VPPFDFVYCPLQLALGQQGAVLTMVEEKSLSTNHWRSDLGLAENFGNFLPSIPLWRWEKRFDEENHIFLYEFSAAFAYMGKMSTPLPTGGEIAV